MKSFLDKNCRENQNAHPLFNNVFPKLVPFVSECGKHMVEPDRLQKIYNTAHAFCLLVNQDYRPHTQNM